MITIHGYNCTVCSRPGGSGVLHTSVCSKCRSQFRSKGVINNISIGIICLDKVYGIQISDIAMKTNRPTPVVGRAILYLLVNRCASISSSDVSKYLSSLNPLGKTFKSSSLRHKVAQLENDYLNDDISKFRMDSAMDMYCKLMVERHFSQREMGKSFFGEDFVDSEMSSVISSLFSNGSNADQNKVLVAMRALKTIISQHYVYTGINTSSASRPVYDQSRDKKPSLRHALGLEVRGTRNEHTLELHAGGSKTTNFGEALEVTQ
jgi:hypothetical protein